MCLVIEGHFNSIILPAEDLSEEGRNASSYPSVERVVSFAGSESLEQTTD